MTPVRVLRAGLLLAAAALLGQSAWGFYSFPGDIRPGHTPVGNYYDSWSSEAEDVLTDGANNSYTWKDVLLDHPSSAMLHLGYDDGAIVWVNGTTALYDPYAAHGVGYWDADLDISSYVHHGRNRITIVVYNSCYAGCCEGGLDLELVVDGTVVMPAGSGSYFNPANEVWYTGGDCYFMPPTDYQGLSFEAADYGWVPDDVEAVDTPQAFELSPAFPNPFNPRTTLVYTLGATSEITLAVFDAAGRQVRLLERGLSTAGEHHVSFEAGDLPGGLYFARLQAEGRSQTQKLLLVK